MASHREHVHDETKLAHVVAACEGERLEWAGMEFVIRASAAVWVD